MATKSQIAGLFQELSPRDQAELIDELIVSAAPSRFSAAWQTELNRRKSEHDADPSTALTFEELDQRIRARITQ